MFTANDARKMKKMNDYSFDIKLKQLVSDAGDEKSSYVKIYWGPHMERRAECMSAELQSRGFTVTEIRDLDSFRFAEVHFTWE